MIELDAMAAADQAVDLFDALKGMLACDAWRLAAQLALSASLVRAGRKPGRVVGRVASGGVAHLLTEDDVRDAWARFRATIA